MGNFQNSLTGKLWDAAVGSIPDKGGLSGQYIGPVLTQHRERFG